MEKVKGELVYKDDDELETGMQKVQPLQFLGEEDGLAGGCRDVSFLRCHCLYSSDEEILKHKKEVESAMKIAKEKRINDGN